MSIFQKYCVGVIWKGQKNEIYESLIKNVSYILLTENLLWNMLKMHPILSAWIPFFLKTEEVLATCY